MSPTYPQWKETPAWAQHPAWARPSRKLHVIFATLVSLSVLLAVFYFHGNVYDGLSTTNSIQTLPTIVPTALPLSLSVSLSSTSTPTPTPTPTPSSIPKKVWQTWKEPAQGLASDMQPHAQTWTAQNPEYRYELLTDASAFAFIEDKFANESRIVDVFNATTDTILRADMTRYLAILAEGGVYSDIDTDCHKPIDQWIPSSLVDKVGLVVGVEYDALGGSLWFGKLPVELVQWTFMAKPGHPVLRRVVDNAMDQLESHNGTAEGWNDVLGITGPRVWTESIYQALSHQTGRNISHHDFFNLTAPKLIADVLILPVNAFASGQPHSNSLPHPNEQELVQHHFHGMSNWVPEHQAKQKAAEEAKQKAEEERKAKEEAEKKAQEEEAKRLKEEAEKKAKEEETARKVREYKERKKQEQLEIVLNSDEVKQLIDDAIADALASVGAAAATHTATP